MVTIRLVKREKRGYSRPPVERESTAEEVGSFLEKQWGRTNRDIFLNTKVGQEVMVDFGGTMTEIGNCWQAAGEDAYRWYCEESWKKD